MGLQLGLTARAPLMKGSEAMRFWRASKMFWARRSASSIVRFS
jgi:hypothetical protein